MKKIVCMGESLIDMIPMNGEGEKYLAKAGGAPANVCACISRLGGAGYYLGKIGTDGFSDLIYDKMQRGGVQLDLLLRDGRYKTAIALVTLKNGDREFSFYRHETADLMLDENEIRADMFDGCAALHFCSVGLVESPSKYAHVKAIKLAREKGAKISFDVNLRLGLYESPAICKETVLSFLPYADILKVTDEELLFLSDEKDERAGVEKLFALSGAKILFLTKGKYGAAVYDNGLSSISEDAADVAVVDTTGAGDCFIGSMLYNIAENGYFENADEYADYLHFATVACGRVIGKKGAMEAMPSLREVKDLL